MEYHKAGGHDLDNYVRLYAIRPRSNVTKTS